MDKYYLMAEYDYYLMPDTEDYLMFVANLYRMVDMQPSVYPKELFDEGDTDTTDDNAE